MERVWLPDISKIHSRFILVGTKKDLRGSKEGDEGKTLVTPEEGRAMATKLGAIDYMECSAMKGEGVTEVFEAATR